MIDVLDNVKQSYDISTTQIDKIILNGKEYRITNVEYYDDVYEEGNIFGTAISRCLDFEIENIVNLEGQEIEYLTGIIVNGTVQWISLGNFIVQDVEPNDTTNIAKVTAMDYMLKTNIEYKSTLNYTSGKITLLQVLQEVCTNSGLVLATTNFANKDFIVDSNQFAEGSLNRQVIQAVAQISGTIAKIKNDNKLYLINPNEITILSKVFTLNNYKEAEIKRTTHPINLVSLSMADIEGENITLRDEESILQNGENSLVINDNPFAYTQTKREQLITALFNAVKGFEYKAYTFKCQGLPYIETMDKIQFKDKEGNIYDSYVFSFNYKSPNGLESTIEAPSIIKATVEYQNIPDALDIAKRTEIIVDKQNKTINLISKQQKTDKLELQQAIGATEEEFSKFVDETYAQQINSLQSQIDGQIMSFFYDYEPTLSNIPASEWTDEDEKIKHMGDLFYNSSNGLAYRFSYIDNQWIWVEIQDTDVGKAIANAESALNVANNKRRVFTIQPTPPYDVGDLWITDTKELKSCIVAKENGSYEETDWQDFVYTEKINEATEMVNVIEETVANLKIETDSINATVSETVTKLENDYLTAEQIEAENDTIKEDVNIIKQQQASMELKSTGLQIQIDTINNEGVKTVKNTTVDINEDGVTVGKSDSEFSTTINNTGTYMYAYEKQIAKYDKDGVETANFKATGEVELGYLKLIKAEVNGEKRTHIHWIGG